MAIIHKILLHYALCSSLKTENSLSVMAQTEIEMLLLFMVNSKS